MTDEEAEALLPAVEELLDAVLSRDALVVEACLRHTPPSALAVILAELLLEKRGELSMAYEALMATHDIEPAGISKWRAWEIAVASEERKAA